MPQSSISKFLRSQPMLASLVLLGLLGCNAGDRRLSNTPPPQAQQPAAAKTQAPPPLIAATLAGDLETVQSLLNVGTDPNLIYHSNTALTYAGRDGFTEIARFLIDQGAEVNWIDSEGVTPLILAAFKGHAEIVELLLSQGADRSIKDQWGRTALDYALRRGEGDAIVGLLQQTE